MAYEDILLYFYTGTGNTYRAAAWMQEAAREQGLNARAVAVDAVKPGEETGGPGQLVGLLSPTHGFTAPWKMIRIALELPRGRGADAFTLFTRAGSKLGRLFLPGLEGSAAYLIALILALKGYRVRGVTGLDMPSNWTALHPGFTRAAAEAITARAKPRALAFFSKLLAGETAFRGQVELALGLLLAPISLAYLLMGRFFLAKLFYATSRCDGCGLCARACPAQGVRMLRSWPGKDGPRPYWTFFCESCMRCMNYCPRAAVEASWPFAALAWYVAMIPVSAYVLDGLAHWFTQAAGWKGTLIETLINYPYKLLSLAAAYALFHLAMRIPPVNRLLTLATPTHYYARYREPETKLGEIIRKGNE